jgi:hypothetical protein
MPGVIEGTPTQIACTTQGGKPAPTIHWAITRDAHGEHIVRSLGRTNGSKCECCPYHSCVNTMYTIIANTIDTISLDDVTEDVQQTEGGRFTITSRLRYYAKHTDDSMYITCIVTHEAIEGRRSASVKVNVDCMCCMC